MPKKAFSPAEMDAQRATIMDEASRVMADEGVANLSMRKLADSVGMTAANIYNYFPNKHELFIQTTLRGFSLLENAIAGAVDHQAPPREQLIQQIKASVDFARSWSGYWELMFHPPLSIRSLEGTPLEAFDAELRQKTSAMMMTMFNRVQACYAEDGQVEGDFSPLQVITLMTHIHGLIDLYNHRILDQFGMNATHLVDMVVDESIRLLFPPAAVQATSKVTSTAQKGNSNRTRKP